MVVMISSESGDKNPGETEVVSQLTTTRHDLDVETITPSEEKTEMEERESKYESACHPKDGNPVEQQAGTLSEAKILKCSENIYIPAPAPTSNNLSSQGARVNAAVSDVEITKEMLPNGVISQEMGSNTVTIAGNSVDDDDPFSHLQPDEAEILRSQINVPTVQVGFITLYRYATTNDLIIILISLICSIAAGAALPAMTVLFGNLSGSFQRFLVLHTESSEEFNHELDRLVLYYVYLAIGEFVSVLDASFIIVVQED